VQDVRIDVRLKAVFIGIDGIPESGRLLVNRHNLDNGLGTETNKEDR